MYRTAFVRGRCAFGEAKGGGTRRLRFVFAVPRGGRAKIERYTTGVRDIVDSPVEGRTLELLRAADVGIIKSGTSTLEAAALDLPQVVVYEAPPLLHLQVKLTGLRRKIRFIAMPNIILGREAVLELLGENCRAPRIVKELTSLMQSPERIVSMCDDYRLVRRALGSELDLSATKATVEMIENLVAEPKTET